MDLKTAVVETTGTVRGERIYRQRTVRWDSKRGVEQDFCPARPGVPAQHRIFVRDTTNRFEAELGPSLVPTLITRFVQ